MLLPVVLRVHGLSRAEKLLADIRANPRATTFADLRRVLEYQGVTVRQGKGSHFVAERDGKLYTIRDPGPGRQFIPSP